MFPVSPSGCGPPYASVPEWWYGFECHSELNVPSPLVLAYFSSRSVEETDLCEFIRRIAVSNFIVLVLASFFACARDGHEFSMMRAVTILMQGFALGCPRRFLSVTESHSRSCCRRSVHRTAPKFVIKFDSRASCIYAYAGGRLI